MYIGGENQLLRVYILTAKVVIIFKPLKSANNKMKIWKIHSLLENVTYTGFIP